LRTGKITLSIESQFRNVFLIGLAVKKIASFAQLSDQVAFEMEVAVVEAVNNAVEHAHHYQGDKLVTVRIRTRLDQIIFTIIDNGAPINFEAAIAASVVKSARAAELGRGLTMMHALMDEVRYERTIHSNHITMVKYLKCS